MSDETGSDAPAAEEWVSRPPERVDPPLTVHDLVIRLHVREPDGTLRDRGDPDFDVSLTGGTLPSIGDRILAWKVRDPEGEVTDPRNRTWLKVTARYFGYRDRPFLVALVVEEEPGSGAHRFLV